MTSNLPPSDTADVFIVDDDPDVRDSVKLLLEAAGFRAEAFDLGQGVSRQ